MDSKNFFKIELQLRYLDRFKQLAKTAERYGVKDISYLIACTAKETIYLTDKDMTLLAERNLEKRRIVLPFDSNDFLGSVNLEDFIKDAEEADYNLRSLSINRDVYETLSSSAGAYDSLMEKAGKTAPGDKLDSEEEKIERVFCEGINVLKGLCDLTSIGFTIKNRVLNDDVHLLKPEDADLSAKALLEKIYDDIGWLGVSYS